MERSCERPAGPALSRRRQNGFRFASGGFFLVIRFASVRYLFEKSLQDKNICASIESDTNKVSNDIEQTVGGTT